MFGTGLQNTHPQDFVLIMEDFAVADPGFPRGGGDDPRGAPTYDFAKFFQKTA